MRYCCECRRLLLDVYYAHNKKSYCPDCYSHVFWEEVLNSPETIIYNGMAYCPGNNESFRKFNITLTDGRKLEKVGLWVNGKIPSSYEYQENVVKMEEV